MGKLEDKMIKNLILIIFFKLPVLALAGDSYDSVTGIIYMADINVGLDK
jgi:hypothetical protein